MHLIRGTVRLTQTLSSCVATIGNFDGVHCGHQELLARVTKYADAHQLPSVLISFEPSAKEFFSGKNSVQRITRLRDKWQFLSKNFSLDYLVLLRFNAELAALSAEKFVYDILVGQLQVKHLIVGEDFRFGTQRAGDIQLLQILGKKFGFTVEVVPTIVQHGIRVSSTEVRQALTEGNMSLAAELLGRYYSISGKVIRGDKRGRLLGFPTANIGLQDRFIPVAGIFVVYVSLGSGKRLQGVANVGIRPTVHGKRMLLEVYIFDFAKDIYGKTVQVEFLHKLRDEERFPSLEALKQAIQIDVENAHEYFANR